MGILMLCVCTVFFEISLVVLSVTNWEHKICFQFEGTD